MHQIIKILSLNPVARTVLQGITNEITEHGIYSLYDKAMNKLARKIALDIIENEKQQKQEKEEEGVSNVIQLRRRYQVDPKP